ncbi:MAG: DUF4364 family protein [Tissierellia bacterium]|nr:DUF4364 family protein [Tissierellia bacterium]
MFFDNTQELAQNKLLLLYIVNESYTPLSNEKITEIVLEKDYMNYFLIQQYLSELVETDFIACENDGDKKLYKILDKGKTTLYYFQDRLPDDLKNEISLKFNQVKEEEKSSKEIVSEYFKKDNNQYLVNLKLIENMETLFSLYLDVPTEKQAKQLSEKWKSNPEYIYVNILNLLLDEDITSV